MSPSFLLPSLSFQVGGPTAQQAMGYEEFARCLPGFLPSTPGVKVGMTDVSYSLVLSQSSTAAVITSSTSRDDSCGRRQGTRLPRSKLTPSHSLIPSSHPVTASFQAPVTASFQASTQSQPHSKLPPSHSLIPSSHPVTVSFQAPVTASFQALTLSHSHAAFESGRKPGRSSLGTSLVAHSFGFSDA